MLDRMSLSMKNGWLDDENRAYIIYAVENIMETLSLLGIAETGNKAVGKFSLGMAVFLV